MARVVSINISAKKGVKKTPVPSAKLVAGTGIDGDAHAGGGKRQVSLLAVEDIEKTGLAAGDYAENITAEGVDFSELRLGTRIKIGAEVMLEISRFGKECHTRCAVYNDVGDCIMPKKGVFAEVIRGGSISFGDDIVLI